MKDFEESDRFAYDLNRESVVFDVGGYHGEFMQKLSDLYGCRVICFEPVREFYLKCLQVSERYPNVLVLNMGLSDSMRRGVIYLSDNSSSEHKKNGPTEIVQFTNLYRVMSATGIQKVDLLKLNCEGSEFEILEQLLISGDVKKFDNLQIQPHKWAKNAEQRWDTIVTALQDTHDMTFGVPWVWYNFKLK